MKDKANFTVLQFDVISQGSNIDGIVCSSVR